MTGQGHSRRLAVGVDIGGSKILAVVADGHGGALDEERRVTPRRTTAPSVVEDAIVDAVQALRGRHEIDGVGVGAAGFVDRTRTVVSFAPHLSWREEPLALRLRARLGCDVRLENDANAALWAESRFGAARSAEDVVMVTLGTGIGGAVMTGGTLYRGHNGTAGEFGHMQVVPDGRSCECGQKGCWEQYCSGKALTRLAHEAGSANQGQALMDAALAGDPASQRAFSEVGRWLGVGLANVVAALDPAMVVIGGGAAIAGDLLLVPAREAFNSAVVGRGYRQSPKVALAELGAYAGAIGAAALMMYES